jgi:hypothetical protein
MILHAELCVKYYFMSFGGFPRLSADLTASFQLPSIRNDSGFGPLLAGGMSLWFLDLRFFVIGKLHEMCWQRSGNESVFIRLRTVRQECIFAYLTSG